MYMLKLVWVTLNVSLQLVYLLELLLQDVGQNSPWRLCTRCGVFTPHFDYKISVAQIAYFHIDFPKDTSFK